MQIGVTDLKPTLKASTFASRTSPSTNQSLQKSLLSPPKKNYFLKFPPLLNIFKTATTTQPIQTAKTHVVSGVTMTVLS